MPNTEFAEKIYFSEDVLTVKGTLENPDKNDSEATVFAFVTQQQACDNEWPARTVTVAGKAELCSIAKPQTTSRTSYTWSLVSSAPTVDPSPTGWGFDTQMKVGEMTLREGWAFGTAVLVALQKDGTIETYAWSGWVKIGKKRAAAKSSG
jgi:hypothetical protein